MSDSDDVFESVYLSHTVLGAHRLTVFLPTEPAGSRTREVRLWRDPNTCALNAFGDTTVCSEEPVAFEFFDGELLELEDPTGANRQVWRLNHKPETGPHTYDVSLVVDEAGGQHRLVATENLNDPAADVITVVPLARRD